MVSRLVGIELALLIVTLQTHSATHWVDNHVDIVVAVLIVLAARALLEDATVARFRRIQHGAILRRERDALIVQLIAALELEILGQSNRVVAFCWRTDAFLGKHPGAVAKLALFAVLKVARLDDTRHAVAIVVEKRHQRLIEHCLVGVKALRSLLLDRLQKAPIAAWLARLIHAKGSVLAVHLHVDHKTRGLARAWRKHEKRRSTERTLERSKMLGVAQHLTYGASRLEFAWFFLVCLYAEYAACGACLLLEHALVKLLHKAAACCVGGPRCVAYAKHIVSREFVRSARVERHQLEHAIGTRTLLFLDARRRR